MYRHRLGCCFTVQLLAGISGVLMLTNATAQSLSQGSGDLRVMTYNVDRQRSVRQCRP